MEIYQAFHPLTATPYGNTAECVEILPCVELRPYIRCFWGSRCPRIHPASNAAEKTIVTPDTCVDIIFTVNYTDNKIESRFCGIDDETFVAMSKFDHTQKISTFAVRFYAWSAIVFADESMKGTKNQCYDAGIYFHTFQRKMEEFLFQQPNMEQRCSAAEKYLMERLQLKRQNTLFMRGIGKIVEEHGNVKALGLATDLHISSRQMERVFLEHMGVPPKKAIDLIRYQCLWQEICSNPHFHILDAVCKYGYVDQSHLLNDFRKKHSMSIKEAIIYAKNVEYLQEKSAIIV